MVYANYKSLLVIVVYLLLLIGCLNFLAFSQLVVTPVTPDKKAPPGEFVSLVFSVTNNYGGSQDVDFDLLIPDHWSLMATPAPVTIPAGGKETIFVTVQIPATAKAGDYSVSLEAKYGGNLYKGTATVNVTKVKGVSVSAPAAKTVSRDSSLSYVFKIKNTGNVTDTFAIEAKSGHGWIKDFSPDSLQLFPGMAKKVKLDIYVPEDAVPGRDPVTVTAISNRNKEIRDEETVFTRILPPSPQAVGGELYAILPARLEGNFTRNMSSDAPSGDLNLSASGKLGGGNLNIDFSLSDVYTDNRVEWNAFDYGGDDFQVNTGGVGLTYSNLISMSGSGISATFSNGNFSLSLLDLYPDVDNGGAQLSYENDELYLSANLANLKLDNGKSALTESVVGRFSEEDFGEMELEAGFTMGGEDNGQAYRFYGETDFEPIILEGEVFYIGTGFAGSGSGDKGIRVSQSAIGEDYNQDLTYSYYFGKTGGSGTKSNLRTDRLAANLVIDVLGLTGVRRERKMDRTLRISGSYSMTNQEDTRSDPTLDENTQKLHGSVFYRYKNLEFSLSAREEIRTNDLSGETFELFDLNQSFGFTYKGVEFSASNSNSLTENLTTEERVSTEGITSFEISKTGTPYVGFSLSKIDQSISFTLDTTINPAKNLELSINATSNVGQDEISFGGGLFFNYEYDLPLKFIITQGRVDGYIFVDQNGNGKKDEGEKGIPEVVLKIENTKVASGKEGYFKFPPLTPGRYELKIPDLPSNYGLEIELPKKVKVEKGEETSTSIPTIELSAVNISVFNDSNENGKRETDEVGIKNVGVKLEGGTVKRKRFTNNDGIIQYRGLDPGKYSIVLDKESLPPRSDITTENAEFSFELGGGKDKEIAIGSFQRPKEIIFGQPPEPEFAFSPEVPRPGQQTNFSGGLSTDPDGEIAKYEWDFQEDAQVEKTGKIVSFSFPEAGIYKVTLIVTDDEGNDVSMTKEIKVAEKE